MYAASRAAPSRGRRTRPVSPRGRSTSRGTAPSRRRGRARAGRCTANSTSRSPPEPSLNAARVLGGMCSRTRRRIACTSVTKPSRSAADHTIGPIRSQYSRPSAASLATGRAFAGPGTPGLGPPPRSSPGGWRRCGPAAPTASAAAPRRPARSCLGGVVGADPHHVRGDSGGLDGRRLLDAVGRLEDDVHVADVAGTRGRRTCPSRPPRAGRARGVPDPGPGDRQRRLERPAARSDSFGGHVVHAHAVREVAEASRSSSRRYSTRSASTAAVSSMSETGVASGRVGLTARRSARSANAGGRVDPRSGLVSSRHCSGWCSRWSPRAELRRARAAAASRSPRRRSGPRAAPCRRRPAVSSAR